jgi:hypothetical protein
MMTNLSSVTYIFCNQRSYSCLFFKYYPMMYNSLCNQNL